MHGGGFGVTGHIRTLQELSYQLPMNSQVHSIHFFLSPLFREAQSMSEYVAQQKAQKQIMQV